jgi:hypothetical protein
VESSKHEILIIADASPVTGSPKLEAAEKRAPGKKRRQTTRAKPIVEADAGG